MCSKIKSPEQLKSLLEVSSYFNSEKRCLEYLEQWLWEGKMKCPGCKVDNFYRYSNGVRLKCKVCSRYFTAKIGTIFEGSKLPMVKWFMAIYLIANNKKGIASTQLATSIGVTQKTSWFMLHRIRKSLDQSDVKLQGIVSSDEAVVGGKNKNRHSEKKLAYSYGRNFKDKVPVLGMMEKDGLVKTVVLPSMRHSLIKYEVLNTVKRGSILVTDEYGAYKSMKKYYQHCINNHLKRMYVSKEGYSSNNIEGFWSHLKRMIIGVYHGVSRKHLQKYCDELTFRFNTRSLNTGERFKLLISKINTPIKYKQLIANV